MRGLNAAVAALLLLSCLSFSPVVAQNGAKRVENDAGFSVKPTNTPSASVARQSNIQRDPPAGFPFQSAADEKKAEEAARLVAGASP